MVHRQDRETAWRPSAPLANLESRAQLLRAIRSFFDARGVLELETPVLGEANVPDPEVHGMLLAAGECEAKPHLQTSPELYLKRWLVAERRDCFELTRAFRRGDYGARHNPEFTLLEWYRVGWSTQQLGEEVCELLTEASQTVSAGSPRPSVRSSSYARIFQEEFGIDPHGDHETALVDCAVQHGGPGGLDGDGALHYLFGAVLEPGFPKDEITIVHGFPISQAALAHIQTSPDGTQVADRFEVFFGGFELANGYGELTDPAEQRARFERDARTRERAGHESAGDASHFLDALEHGLPACAGVALGVDRLLMAILGETEIARVMAFR